jgi:CheY-like chemotaxis protein
MKKSFNILVLDDKETNAVAVALYCWGHAPTVFDNTPALFDALKKSSDAFDAVIIDLDLSAADAILLDELLHQHPLPCLVLNTPVNHTLTYSKITHIESKADIEKLLSWLGEVNKSERVFKEKNPLFTLVYASHAVGETTPSDVMDILKVARRINKELEITGVLLYNGGWWLQVLEGSFSAVTSLFFDHIQKDKRHKNVTLLVLDPSTERQFANWDMGFYSTQAQQDSNLSWTDLDTHPAGKLIKQKLSNAQEYTSYFMK